MTAMKKHNCLNGNHVSLHNETFLTKKEALIYENGLDSSLQVCVDMLEKNKPRKKKIFASKSDTFHSL